MTVTLENIHLKTKLNLKGKPQKEKAQSKHLHLNQERLCQKQVAVYNFDIDIISGGQNTFRIKSYVSKKISVIYLSN